MRLFDWFSKKQQGEVDTTKFSQLEIGDRMRLIMNWGDKGDDSKLRLFQYVILNDPHPDVKMAAFKRIHLFQDKDNVKQFLSNEQTKEIGQACEPYYSMALSRTGIISIEEFKRRINNA